MKPRAKSIPTFESRTFAVEITGTPGEHRLKVLALPYFQTFLNKTFKPGEQATLSITSRKPKRTEAQHRYYWVYVGDIARETGNDPEALHELFKTVLLPGKSIEVMGHTVVSRPSTKTLTRIEFGEYIDRIAEMTGIEPPPLETIRGL